MKDIEKYQLLVQKELKEWKLKDPLDLPATIKYYIKMETGVWVDDVEKRPEGFDEVAHNEEMLEFWKKEYAEG